MTADDRANLVAAWVEHPTFLAFEEMDRLCRSQPEICWELILEILQTPHHESVEAALAAGPLEDLIAKHGARFIEQIEARAKTDRTFKDLLGGVLQNETPKEPWARVEAVRGRHGEQ